MTQLSALVVVHDEEDQLADCLETLRFADQVVVVLDRCTDGSKAIAERFGATLLAGAWEIEGPRRNDGIAVCAGEWILEVDADERVPPALAEEIRAELAHASRPAHYLIPYDNYIGERLVRYGWGAHWGVSATVRLFSKGAKRWGDQRLHPPVTLQGEKRTLRSAMVHLVDRDISDMLARLDRYTTAKAADLRASGQIGGFWGNARRMVSRFLKCFVMRRGYREGSYGFLIALMAALYPMLSYLKARLDRP
ncbi:MAG: glycosyltransferase family 2 protein [Alphaproteobacteria bacterium]|nr:glycosyltransferase family 2 protein [Alphaproteobacteria bacterium]